MIKQYSTFSFFCCIIIFLFISCKNNVNENVNQNINNTNNVINQGNNIIENELYAIYSSNIIESNETEINKYVHYERNIDIKFPQIYYSNEYNKVVEDIEIDINKMLFSLSLGNDNSFLFERDNRDLKEYKVNYLITKGDKKLFSIQYIGYLYSISHALEFCYGITINAETGERVDLSDYIELDDSLIEAVKKGNIKYSSSAGYEKDIVVYAVSEFINDYQNDSINTNNCFYIGENSLNIIVPINQGNRNYIILELPLELN